MLNITKLNGEAHLLTNVHQVQRKRKVNGEKTISFSVLPDERNAHAWESVANESLTTFLNEPYTIKALGEKSMGSRSTKQVDAVHSFFTHMMDCYQEDVHSGSLTFSAALTKVFEKTTYSFVVVDPLGAQTVENFGASNCLALFQKVLESYGSEFRIVGKQVFLHEQIGADTGFQFRWDHNVKAIDKNVDTKNLATYIKGYGKLKEDAETLTGDARYMAIAEYTSPNAALYPNAGSPDGLRHAGEVYDERFTTNAALLTEIKSRLQDEPELSITVDIAELGLNIGALNEGDRGYIIYEPMNIKVGARIVEIDETFEYIDDEWVLIKTAVTLSNSLTTLTDITTRFAETSKRVGRLFSGLEKLPFNALDEATAQATKALLSAQTELEFVNGIIARDKTDANKLVAFNSGGLGISDDGGQTFGTAITGDGIVAEYIMAGTLRGMTFESESADSRMWIQGGDIRLEDTSNGQYLNQNSRGFTGFDSAGNILFQANKTWVTTSIVGTNTVNFYMSAYNEARAVHFDGLPGNGAVDAYTYIPLRAEGFKGNYLDVNSGTASINLYLRPLQGGEVRVTAAGTTDIYYPLRASTLLGTAFVTTTTNAYIGTDDELRVVSKGGATTPGTGDLIYRNVKANGYFGQFLAAEAGFYAYVGTDLGLRVTSRGLASAGPIYRDVIAAGFTNGSRIESKENIELWAADALALINESDLTTYHLKGDLEQERIIRKYGLVLGGGYRTPQEVVNGDGIDQYAMTTVAWRAIQQLTARIEQLEMGL